MFITPQDAAYGFSLTGFQQVISDRETVLAELEKIVLTGSSGLVLIDERLLNDKVSRRIEVIEKKWKGAIVILPEPGTVSAEPGKLDFGMQLIARVLGYQMKLS